MELFLISLTFLIALDQHSRRSHSRDQRTDARLDTDQRDLLDIFQRLIASRDAESSEIRKITEELSRIALQQDRRAEYRALFAFIWVLMLGIGWGCILEYYVFWGAWDVNVRTFYEWSWPNIKTFDSFFSGRWLDTDGILPLDWTAVSTTGSTLLLTANWFFLILAFGILWTLVLFRNYPRCDFPKGFAPVITDEATGAWGTEEFDYQPLTTNKASNRIRTLIFHPIRYWALEESDQRDIERRALYMSCLHFRHYHNQDEAEVRETSAGRRILEQQPLCESPVEDKIVVEKAIGYDRIPATERPVLQVQEMAGNGGGRRRRKKQLADLTGQPSNLVPAGGEPQRVTRLQARRMAR